MNMGMKVPSGAMRLAAVIHLIGLSLWLPNRSLGDNSNNPCLDGFFQPCNERCETGAISQAYWLPNTNYFYACVGQPFSAPEITSVVSNGWIICDDGYNTITANCPDKEHYGENPNRPPVPVYYESTNYFEPPIPPVYNSPRLYAYTAKVKAWSSSYECPGVLERTIGSLTVKVLKYAFRQPSVGVCWSSGGVYDAADNLTYDSYDTTAMHWSLETLEGDQAASIESSSGEVHYGVGGGKYTIWAHSSETDSCGTNMTLTVSKVDISGGPFVCCGDVVSLTASGGTSPYAWTSGNSAVLAVDDSGNLSGVAPGSAVITATDASLCSSQILMSAVAVGLDAVEDVCVSCPDGDCAQVDTAVQLQPLSVSGLLTLTLLDEQGSPFKVLYSEADMTGDVQVPWDASAVPPGVYALLAEWNLGSATCSEQSDPFTIFSLENMRVRGNEYPVPPGGTAQMLIDVLPAGCGRTVAWSIAGVTPDSKKTPPRATLDSSGLVVVDPKSGTGWLTIRAADSENEDCYSEAQLYVGCPCANGCSSISGGGFVNLGSVDVRIGLGASRAGKSAGELCLREDELATNVYAPSALKLSTLDPAVQTRMQDGWLRQVRAPHALVDVATNSATDYSLVFYRDEDVAGTNASGLFVVVPNAVPISTWRIYNPDQNANQHGRLAVEETVGSNVKSYAYEWDAGSNAWSLLKAGLQKETREVEQAGAFRIETTKLADTNGVAASIVEQTFATVGSNEVVVSDVVDPNGANLRTEYQYQTNSQLPGFGRQASVVYPDGSWVRYGYDQDGRTTNEVKSWLNAPTNATPTVAREIRYSYAPVDAGDAQLPEDRLKPRTEAEYIVSVPVAMTYHAYKTNAEGGRIEITEQAKSANSAFGQSGNLRTVREYHPNLGDDPASLKVKTETYPDGRQDSYGYVLGTYMASPAPGTFSVGTGSNRMETVTHGTIASPEGIQFKTTREVSIYDDWNRQVVRYSEVLTGGGYELLDWTTYEHDEWGRVTGTLRSNGERTETSWDCCGMTSQSDEQGIETVYVRDGLGRTAMEIRNGVTNAFVYDAAGRTLESRQSAGNILLVESNAYDLAGRLLEHTDSADLMTYYEYRDGGRVTVQTLPGGGVQVSSQYLDGHALSVTGKAVVASFYEYGVDTNGMRWTLARTGASNSPMWEKTMTDMLGRTIRTERPSFGGGTSVVESFYDPYGRLATNRQSDAVATMDTLYSYDDLGRVIRSGLDVNGNGVLDVNGMDRLNDSDQYYDYDGTNWWSVSRSEFYPYDNSGQAVTNSISMSRLTGLGTASGAGVLVAERKDADIFGNITVFRRVVDRDAAMVWETTDLPTSIQDVVRVYSNGSVVSETSASGVVVSNEYDAIGRLTETRSGGESREVGRIVSYNSKGQVEWEEDLAGNRTTNSYDPESGLKAAVTDALTNTVHTAYDLQGRPTNVWGATYPVAYEYDAYGRMSAMKTWRDTNGAPDVTHWLYDEASGLLTNKVHADGNGPSYQYDASGRLTVRTWARGVSTDYSYDGLGLLTAIDYSDDTPDVSFTYDRLGRQKTVTDVLGTRTNIYDAASLKEERMPDGTTLARSYDTFGRPSGISLGDDYAVGYGYDDYGRLSTVWPSNSGGRVDYTYMPGSDLLGGWGVSNGPSSAYSYEANRDVRTNVSNLFDSTLMSAFAYSYDPAGCRTQRVDSGAVTNTFGYNVRSELAAALMGTNQFAYAYDPIGNRVQASFNEEINTYWANGLNQYTNIDEGEIALAYDDDGNIATNGPWRLSWDAENRLVSVGPRVIGGIQDRYYYDYMGRRVKKYTFEWTYPNTGKVNGKIEYLYNGWNCIKHNFHGQDSIVTNMYIWGLDLSGSLQGAGGVGGLLTRYVPVSNALDYVFCDANGNVTELVNTNGDVDAHYEYDPYGDITALSGNQANANPFRFSTKYWDEETGFYYYGYRFYSPGLGRWISRDTIEEQGGLNLYGFVDNDPVNWFDTLGDSKSNGGDDSSTWKDFWKAAVEIHKNYEKYKKLTDQAKQTFRTQINPNYDCCWKCKSGYKVSDWDDPDNPNIGYQVLHRQIGCELQKAGASQEAMALLNVLYETKTSIYEMFAKLEVSKKSGVDDWIWDTAKDMAAVMEGWQQGGGDCATKFIPSECTKKDGK